MHGFVDSLFAHIAEHDVETKGGSGSDVLKTIQIVSAMRPSHSTANVNSKFQILSEACSSSSFS